MGFLGVTISTSYISIMSDLARWLAAEFAGAVDGTGDARHCSWEMRELHRERAAWTSEYMRLVDL